jgi:hypothetical protein
VALLTGDLETASDLFEQARYSEVRRAIARAAFHLNRKYRVVRSVGTFDEEVE